VVATCSWGGNSCIGFSVVNGHAVCVAIDNKKCEVVVYACAESACMHGITSIILTLASYYTA